MNRSQRITLALVVAVAAALGCTSKKEIRAAKSSAYDADFAIVFSEALAAVRELYPELEDDAAKGAIRTAWHQVQFSTGQDDPRSIQQRDRQTANAGVFSGGPQFKRVFIRFDVTVTGGRPWRVRVSGKASEWEPGNAQPTELRGAAAPSWLAGRRDALIVAIHRRLKKYAVTVEEEPEPVAEDETPAVDPTTFGTIPDGAVATATAIVKAVESRNLPALREKLADDVVWSFGAAGDADTALAMWQADPEAMAALARVLRAGCRADEAGKLVTCPPEATESPGYLGWRATLEPRGEAWLLTAFVQGD